MIGSVIKAIDILYTFTSSEPRLTLAEISRRLGLPKSTVHNILQTLLSRGFVEKVDGSRYALGTAIMPLTQAVRVNAEQRDRAAPLLRELSDTSQESVYLTVRDGDCALYIYAIESPRRLLARTAVGERTPLHCTALGKSILGRMPQDEAEEIIVRMRLEPYTAATIVDTDVLRRELATTRERGYALDIGEHEKNTYCIAAAILDHTGSVIGACSVSGADPEIVGSRRDELARQVMHVAQEVSLRMGYVPARSSLVAAPHGNRGSQR